MFHPSLAPLFEYIAKCFQHSGRQRYRVERQFARLAVEVLEDRTVPSIFVVNELADTHAVNLVSGMDSTGNTSLRSAIEAADQQGGTQTIQFDPSVFAAPQTIKLTLGLLDLKDSGGFLTIQGPAAGVAISGNNKFEVFRVETGTTADLIGLTISDGRVAGWAKDYGGGIYNNGSLTISASTIAHNTALTPAPIELFGGVGGGIYNNAALTVVNSTISGNRTGDQGAGIFNSVHGTVALTNCTVADNRLVSDGYGLLGSGGGISNGGSASLTGCTIAGNTSETGGGIGNGGSLTVTDSIIVANTSIAAYGYEGGYQGAGGGIFNSGTATLLDSTISGNTASGYGTGVVGGGVAGANSGPTVLNNCTLSNNSASWGGGVGSLPAYTGYYYYHRVSLSPVTLSNCTISGNKATHNGGGIYIADASELTLTNSTVALNTAAVDGGGVDMNEAGGMISTNNTISANTAAGGGGIFIKEPESYVPSMTLNNTIVAGNTSHALDGDVVGAVVPASVNNLIGDGTGIIGIGNNSNGNQVGTSTSPINPLLAPLGNYGGPTQTMALLPGSPAIDAGSNAAIPSGITTDQRGLPRIVNGTVDIGAFESGTDLAPAITSVSNATFVAGQTGSFTVVTTGFPFADQSEIGALPAGVTFTDNGNGTATIAGTPAAGSASLTPYSFTIQASNGAGTVDQVFALTVNQAPAITSPASATLFVGKFGSFTVTTIGFPYAVLSEIGKLPAGLAFTDNGNGTASLSGTPLAGSARATPYTITIQASNGVGGTITQTFQLTIDQAPVITSTSSANFVVGQAGSFSVKVIPGVPAATKFNEIGPLPKGVTFSSNGVLGGTPAAGTAGIYNFTITASNGLSVTQSFTLTVKQRPAITSVSSAIFMVGQANSFTITTTGFPLAILSTIGALPAGLTFTDNGDGTATLSGTPLPSTVRPTPYSFTIEANNGVGAIVKQTFKLLID